jgi:acyl carrier protein
MTDYEQVLSAVRSVLVDCLGVEEDEVTPDANFFHDLGGESIDVLDAGFRLEQRYGVRLAFQQLMSADQWTFDARGRLTPDALRGFSERYPFLTLPEPAATEGIDPHDLFTVDFITRAVLQALAAKSMKAAG